MSEKSVYVYLIINIILFCCNLAFTIGGSIILDQTSEVSDSSNQFFQYWLSNIILTVVSGIISVSLLLTCCGLTQLDKDNQTSSNQLIELCALGVAIWMFVIYFGHADTVNDLKSQHYSLYILTSIRVYYSLTLLSIVGLILGIALMGCLFGGMYMLCCSKEEDDDEEKVNTDQLNNLRYDNQSGLITSDQITTTV